MQRFRELWHEYTDPEFFGEASLTLVVKGGSVLGIKDSHASGLSPLKS
jgi:hypothetical protein